VEIGAAHPASGDVHKHLSRSRNRFGSLSRTEGLAGGVEHHRTHETSLARPRFRSE
jgi:hypothetical protein